MINRIRDIRAQKGMTLAQVAAACNPPTTAQTIGRLETGMRNLSLIWMNRIAAALGVEPEVLLRSETAGEPLVTAMLNSSGAQAPTRSLDALLPTALAGEGALRVLAVEVAVGDYRAGDQIWLREWSTDRAGQAINQDVLVPQSGGHFVFGRLLQHDRSGVSVLPAGNGQKQVTVEAPVWLAVAEMLVRKL
jgi:transcriptional regulator with XRE-family HTH domain